MTPEDFGTGVTLDVLSWRAVGSCVNGSPETGATWLPGTAGPPPAFDFSSITKVTVKVSNAGGTGRGTTRGSR